MNITWREMSSWVNIIRVYIAERNMSEELKRDVFGLVMCKYCGSTDGAADGVCNYCFMVHQND